MKTLAVLLIALTTTVHAQAYTVTLEQVRSNVVATGSGVLDLTGLTLVADDAFGGPGINPFLGNIVTGSSNPCDLYGARSLDLAVLEGDLRRSQATGPVTL
jgi:hypothetical protein